MPHPDAGGTKRLEDQREMKKALKGVNKSKAVAVQKQKIKQRKKVDTAPNSLLPKYASPGPRFFGGAKKTSKKAPKKPVYVFSGLRSIYFPKTGRGEKFWKSIPEAKFKDDGKDINPREPFVSGKDGFGGKVILRKSAMRAFYRARKIAESGKYQTPPGFVVRLRVTSSYRSKADQRRLNPSGKSGKYVAIPGTSWHHSGGAIDVIAYVQNHVTGKWEGGWRHMNQIYLKKIMPRSSFVNLPHEMWHWEYGTTRWKRKTGRKTRTYKKVMSVNSKRLPKL